MAEIKLKKQKNYLQLKVLEIKFNMHLIIFNIIRINLILLRLDILEVNLRQKYEPNKKIKKQVNLLMIQIQKKSLRMI